jgi:hypothetical protein
MRIKIEISYTNQFLIEGWNWKEISIQKNQKNKDRIEKNIYMINWDWMMKLKKQILQKGKKIRKKK